MLSDTNMTGNTASSGGGGIDNFGTLTVRECVLSGNTANMGGGILNSANLTVLDSTLLGNTAALGSDLFDNIHFPGASVSIIDSLVGVRYDA
jgi:hypothetical protein